MAENKLKLSNKIFWIPLILAFGMIISGMRISKMVLKGKMQDRYVTVKGLSERDVKADFAIWPLVVRVNSNNVADGNKKLQEDTEIVKAFLFENDIKPEELESGHFNIIENMSPDNRVVTNYTLTSTILIKTKNVEAIKNAYSKQYLLAQKGILMGERYSYSGGPFYEYNAFKDLKSEMLSEAIKNARIAAEQFGKDANCRIGKLKKANQGSFSISPAVGQGLDEGNYKRAFIKNIRAVATLEYEIE